MKTYYSIDSWTARGEHIHYDGSIHCSSLASAMTHAQATHHIPGDRLSQQTFLTEQTAHAIIYTSLSALHIVRVGLVEPALTALRRERDRYKQLLQKLREADHTWLQLVGEVDAVLKEAGKS